MKINFLKIQNYYVLKDFEIYFKHNKSIVIGENGSGKSSILETIALIFGHLRKYFIDNDKTAEFIADYTVNFDSTIISGDISQTYNVEVSSLGYKTNLDDSGIFDYSLRINNKALDLQQANEMLESIGGFKTLLPDNIILYYAGFTNRLMKLCTYFDEKYRRSITRTNTQYSLFPLSLPNESPFYYSKPSQWSRILLCLLISDNTIHSDFINRFIGNVNLSKINITIIIKKPIWAVSKTNSDTFWGANEGVIRDFLSLLINFSEECIYKDQTISISYNSCFPIIDLATTISNKNKEQTLFKLLNLIEYNDLLKDIEIDWTDNHNTIEIDRISEGQKQMLSTLGLIFLFNSNNNLILLDEPDTFLHPKWQIYFVDNLNKITNSHCLISTHSINILNHIKDVDLHLLKHGLVDQNTPTSNFGRTISYINYNLMGIEERPIEIQKQLDDLSIYLEDENIEEATKVYLILVSKVGENDSDMKKAKIELDYIKSLK